MKRFTVCVILATAVLAGLGAGCRLSDKRTFTIRAPGVKNEACAQRVVRALAPLDGVEIDKIGFDYAQGTITVTYESMKLGRKNIEHAIAHAGFDANTIPATDAARAALPEACR